MQRKALGRSQGSHCYHSLGLVSGSHGASRTSCEEAAAYGQLGDLAYVRRPRWQGLGCRQRGRRIAVAPSQRLTANRGVDGARCMGLLQQQQLIPCEAMQRRRLGYG